MAFFCAQFMFWRRRMSHREGGRRLDPDELARLEEERDFLLASLADLDAEHEAGDLDDEDHEALREDYTARAAETLRAIEDQRAAFAEARPARSPLRMAGIAAGVVVLAVVAGILVAQASGRREGGEVATGDVPQTARAEAQSCIDLASEGEALGALRCFDEVLADHPNEPSALAYRGWTLVLTGEQTLVEDGQRSISRAIEADPDYPDARIFSAILAVREGRDGDARRQLGVLDDLENVPPFITNQARAVRAQLDGAATPTTPSGPGSGSGGALLPDGGGGG